MGCGRRLRCINDREAAASQHRLDVCQCPRLPTVLETEASVLDPRKVHPRQHVPVAQGRSLASWKAQVQRSRGQQRFGCLGAGSKLAQGRRHEGSSCGVKSEACCTCLKTCQIPSVLSLSLLGGACASGGALPAVQPQHLSPASQRSSASLANYDATWLASARYAGEKLIPQSCLS